ncbi:LytTR family DNA-binding domain-containing protein [Micromonospora sp. NPDC002389]|uniref:LytTR family DNA-binding domain-containing protein n=1 Tax=Micromonospora sp. NPDC002389 TaxID=3154272 RepID=UPI00332A3B9F
MSTDHELERRTWVRVALICVVTFPLVAAVNAMTLVTDARRSTGDVQWAEPWLLEMTSVVGALLLVPAVAALERRVPLVSGMTLRHGAVLLAASVPFSLAHVGIMVGLRTVLIPLATGKAYAFFVDPLTDLLYEYRKDLFLFVVITGLLTLSRQIELGRQETAAARADARESGRLTLKSQGHTIHLRARDFSWAQASGNYVDVMAAGKSYLPRTTLNDLEQQLHSAKVDVVRVHRSRLVNREQITEVRPTRSGDVEIHLADGTTVKGSRRYRDRLSLPDNAPPQ